MRTLDLFAREYSWTRADLNQMTVNEINYLIRVIENYHAKAGRVTKGF